MEERSRNILNKQTALLRSLPQKEKGKNYGKKEKKQKRIYIYTQQTKTKVQKSQTQPLHTNNRARKKNESPQILPNTYKLAQTP